jgi:hypothetical protein
MAVFPTWLPGRAVGNEAGLPFETTSAAMSKGPFQFSAHAWQGRVDSGEFTCKPLHSFPFMRPW